LIGGRLQLDFVSYSQLDLFQTCPLKYKYRYILQVPVRPHHALTFGQSIHNTLRDFHRFQQQGQKPDKKTLLHLYEKHFVPFGYESEEHKHKRFDSGKKALNAYFDLYQNQFSGKPYWLEKSFRINIADTWLIGKIDRIDKLANGAYELIDYKTGSVKSQQEVDKDVQLTIYKLAAQTAFGIKAQTLALYFLEGNQKLVTRRTLDQLEAKKEDIAQTIAQIRTSTFAATPGYPFPCGYCAYNQICPFAKKS
jgi:DNA helicase-2/ATP-dependent DNA helicase PcrA